MTADSKSASSLRSLPQLPLNFLFSIIQNFIHVRKITDKNVFLFCRDIPLSLLIAISSVVVSFVGASGALTLIVSWEEVSVNTPFPSAYATRGWYWAKYVVSIGALAAMVTCLLSVLFVIPRYLLAMARDGLLWHFFTILNPKTQVRFGSWPRL